MFFFFFLRIQCALYAKMTRTYMLIYFEKNRHKKRKQDLSKSTGGGEYRNKLNCQLV